MNGKQIEQVLRLVTNNESAEQREQALHEAERLLEQHLRTAKQTSGADAAKYEQLLRVKLAAIRDEAMELMAILECSCRGDVTQDVVWQWASRTVRDAEEIVTNSRGELSLPEEQ